MKFLRLISILVILFALGLLVARSIVIKIEIGQVGVLTEQWGDGLVQKDFGPGYCIDIGGLHQWSIYDGTVQTLAMVDGEGEGALQVKSADGATVTVDTTIKYRIKPGECWKLLAAFGAGDSYKIKVRNESINALRPVFGSMSTEDFYSPQKRIEKTVEAERTLRERLLNNHVDLLAILVRDVSFEEAYEQRIKEKALASQDIEVNKALREAAFFRGDTDKIGATTAAKVTVIEQGLEKTRSELTAENAKSVAQILADADRFVVETRADADLYRAQKKADSDRLMKNAEAQAQFLRQQVLRGSGAHNLVALEAARNLKLGSVLISTLENNFLDLPSLADRLGARADAP